MVGTSTEMAAIRDEIELTLKKKVISFWLTRSVDQEFGGYITSFDQNGIFDGNTDKYIVTQCRMIWGFSQLSQFAAEEDLPAVRRAAEQGFEFLIDRFWDREQGGFYWHLQRDGSVADASKLTYGEGFAIYALSEYYLRFGDPEALKYAERTFELLSLYATDTRNGGYFENLEPDWSVSKGGAWAGDRKSLDIHMHLMEAFTTLYEASGKEIHRRKLLEVIELIMNRMVDMEVGYGRNQFDLAFHPIPAINIQRTWNAERETNECIAQPTDTTSYGHNVELSWLLDHAYHVMKISPAPYAVPMKRLLDHALLHGCDREYGGIYRDGIANGDAVVTDKEWWQNFEAMAGFLNGFVQYKDDAYWDAFLTTWKFIKAKFMNMQAGESRQLLDREGNAIVANLGNPWKGIYHTGRALAECLKRFKLLEEGEKL